MGAASVDNSSWVVTISLDARRESSYKLGASGSATSGSAFTSAAASSSSSFTTSLSSALTSSGISGATVSDYSYTTTSADSSGSDSDSGMSGGEIAGLVIGLLIGIGIVVGIVFLFIKFKGRGKQQGTTNEPSGVIVESTTLTMGDNSVNPATHIYKPQAIGIEHDPTLQTTVKTDDFSPDAPPSYNEEHSTRA